MSFDISTIVELVLNTVEETLAVIMRKLYLTQSIAHMRIWKIKKFKKLYLYHLQRVQYLRATDFAPRITFCNWFLPKSANVPRICSLILFTDEVGLSRIKSFYFSLIPIRYTIH